MKIIKIIKCSGSNYWYKNLIGHVFEVYDYGTIDYVLKEDKDHGFYAPWRHLLKDDSQILYETTVKRSEVCPSCGKVMKKKWFVANVLSFIRNSKPQRSVIKP